MIVARQARTHVLCYLAYVFPTATRTAFFIAHDCEQMSLPILYYMYMPHDGIPGSLMEEDCSLCVRLEVISIWTSRFLPLFYRIHLSSLGQGFQVG